MAATCHRRGAASFSYDAPSSATPMHLQPSIPVLRAQLIREMHCRLLAGRHGPAMRHLGHPDSHARCLARAVEIIRSQYAAKIPCRAAHIRGQRGSIHLPSSFPRSDITFAAPVSEAVPSDRGAPSDARGGIVASNAAYAVGYESVPQFTREYRQLFGCLRSRRRMKRGAGCRPTQLGRSPTSYWSD
jgi:AraC-like DNA-binding protein